MPQHDYAIADQTGAPFRGDINNALSAVLSTNSGATAPAVTAAGMLWFDTSTTPPTLRIRNSANTGWNGIAAFDTGSIAISNTVAMSGAQIRQAKGADIAAAATVDLSAATGNNISLTGTGGPITSFGTVPAGAMFFLTTAASVQITHNATSMICQNAQNIITQAGDRVAVESLGAGNWRIWLHTPQLVSAFSAYQSTAQSIAAATLTRVLFQTKEFDNLLEYDAATSRITVKQAGIYMFTAYVHFAAGADGERHMLILYRNDAAMRRLYDSSIGAATDDEAGGSTVVKLAAGDIIDVYIFTSAARATEIGESMTFFSGVRLG